MLAPISWPLPPDGYGPWEQVASNITEELVALGHDVTLFAAGGSATSARLVCTVPYALQAWPEPDRAAARRFDAETGLMEGPPGNRTLEELHIAACLNRAREGEFDIVHSHLHAHALPFGRCIRCPLVSTLHGAAWVRATHPMLLAHKELPFVSISDAERQMLPELNYVGTVHNGIRVESFPLHGDKTDDLLFAGRIAPEKGAAEAVQVAMKSGRRLVMAGMIEPQHQAYFDTHIRPHVDGRNVEYAGLLSQKQLVPLYQKAAAALFLIRWCEPFGMVAVEAQACGTPLIATRRGALPEIIRDGATGFIVENLEQAVAAVGRLDEIDPAACRDNVVTRFSANTMASGYEAIFRKLIEA